MHGKLKSLKWGLTKINWKEHGGFVSMADFVVCLFAFGCLATEYVLLEFNRKSLREKNTYLLYFRNKRINEQIASRATEEQRSRITDKLCFDEYFKDFIHREYLCAGTAGEAKVAAFIEKHKVVLAKPLSGTQGKGILRIEYNSSLDPSTVKKLVEGNYLIEQLIIQHPDLARINPTSVNTVRICTIVDRKGYAHIEGACLRAGGDASFVDNTHSGGVAYPLNTEFGVVIDKGVQRLTMKRFSVHPSTGVSMIGFQVPNWSHLVEQVMKAAESVPETPFLGWDIAVTKDGVEFIESNIGQAAPGIQFDNIGKYKAIKTYLFDL